MARIIKSYITFKSIAFLVLIAGFSALIFSQGYNANVISFYLGSHFLPTFHNVIYILLIYNRVNKLKEMSTYIIQRTGRKKYEQINIVLSIGSLLLYCLLIYGGSLILLPMPSGYEHILLQFLILNTLVFLVIEIIITAQIFYKSSVFYLVVALSINFIFHYAYVVPWSIALFK